MVKQKCYHMTRFLKDIIKNEDEKGFKGLKLVVGENSKYVNDTKSDNIGISYSLGLEGIIATNAMFRARYQYNLLENQTDRNVTLDDMFNQNVQEQEEKFLGSNVYLVFDETDSIRAENEERDIADPKTKLPIDISNIRGVILKNNRTGQIEFDREAIVRYAVSNTQIQDIIENLVSSDRPFMNMEGYAKTDFSFRDYVRRFFLEVSKEPETQVIGNGDWRLQEIDVKELLEIIEKDKEKMESNRVIKLESEKLLSWDLRNWNENRLKNAREQAMQEQEKSKEILSMLKDEQKTDEFLSTLTGEDIKKLLIYINSRVRNIQIEENDIYRGTMYAGELISPNNDIQDRYFEKIASSLKKIEGNRNRATMLHYLVNKLHLFEDGNGRTGRCIFELFTNPEFSFEKNENFTHKLENKVGTPVFEENNGIKFFEEAFMYTSYLTYKALCENGVISQSSKCVSSQTISKQGTDGLQYHDSLFIENSIKEALSTEQIQNIGLALCDNNDLLSVSGLTMMVMQEIKGKKINYEKFESLSEYTVCEFWIDLDNEQSKKTFEGWSKEDYLRAVQIANIIKETMLDAMLDIFEHPDHFTINNSVTIADILSKNLGENDRYLIEIAEELYKNCNVNFNGTRIKANIDLMKEVLRQDISDYSKHTIQEIKPLVEQVMPEISDPIIEDETEKNIEMDLEKIQDKKAQEK